jgi:hypothetical protein
MSRTAERKTYCHVFGGVTVVGVWVRDWIYCHDSYLQLDYDAAADLHNLKVITAHANLFQLAVL